jgi:uncharacterized phiE125 gp8 family phage protein
VPLTRLTPLDGDAILPLADARLHLRITHTDEDSLIASLRDAAVSQVERVSGVALAESEWRWTARRFVSRVDLPMQPVTELGEVTHHDVDGEAATYTGARLIDNSAYPAVGESWPDANGYAAVAFTAGLGSTDEAPELIAAAKLLLGHLYVNREAVSADTMSEVPLGVQALIDTYRAVLV